MVTSHKHGHEIYFDGAAWRYSDNDEPASKDRPCIKCGELPTPEGHDACLGYVPNVRHACCGHGVSAGYLIKKNGYNQLLPKR